MSLRRKRPKPLIDPKIIRRAELLDKDTIWEWCETALNGLVHYVPEHRRTRDPDLLGEIKILAESLYGLVIELQRRQEMLPPSAVRPTRQRI